MSTYRVWYSASGIPRLVFRVWYSALQQEFVRSAEELAQQLEEKRQQQLKEFSEANELRLAYKYVVVDGSASCCKMGVDRALFVSPNTASMYGARTRRWRSSIRRPPKPSRRWRSSSRRTTKRKDRKYVPPSPLPHCFLPWWPVVLSIVPRRQPLLPPNFKSHSPAFYCNFPKQKKKLLVSAPRRGQSQCPTP